MSVDVRLAVRNIFVIARRFTRTRYTRTLESEVAQLCADCARLRSENRALLNSILGIAGIPPVMTNSAELPRTYPSPQADPEAPASGSVSPSTGEGALPASSISTHEKNIPQIAAPLRRRSWQQINRTLEFEAARKKPQRDTADV